ncbi:rubredoxin [Streptomyces sp. enrichment culture]|uniref:rubredoxin n=1 Tax=Streptomyces sp. enrichment culture TaxID=1795815 RepID=UPI003F55656F
MLPPRFLVRFAACPVIHNFLYLWISCYHTDRTVKRKSIAKHVRHQGVDVKVWECQVCGFIYDEAKGWPEEGFPPGTRWADIPDDWACPECGAAKATFEMVEITPH